MALEIRCQNVGPAEGVELIVVLAVGCQSGSSVSSDAVMSANDLCRGAGTVCTYWSPNGEWESSDLPVPIISDTLPDGHMTGGDWSAFVAAVDVGQSDGTELLV